MARIRNPRFCPEFLERKLSPTSLVPVAAQVSRLDDPEPAPPPNQPGTPPPVPPQFPSGPVLPQ